MSGLLSEIRKRAKEAVSMEKTLKVKKACFDIVVSGVKGVESTRARVRGKRDDEHKEESSSFLRVWSGRLCSL